MQEHCPVFRSGEKCLIKCHYAQCFRKQRKDINNPTLIFNFEMSSEYQSIKEVCKTCQYYYDTVDKLTKKKTGSPDQ